APSSNPARIPENRREAEGVIRIQGSVSGDLNAYPVSCSMRGMVCCLTRQTSSIMQTVALLHPRIRRSLLDCRAERRCAGTYSRR
ncbi:MAG TPA: hypothetical protein PLW36_06105, partial [Methanoculleus sp.]|nr:hypothetical protein [Methanoculleus sp.]